MLLQSIQQTLGGLSDLLAQLSPGQYTQPCQSLSGATIGEHTRHIIELFQCLQNQYETGVVNYELRQRNYAIQTDITSAQNAITQILDTLQKPEKNLELQQTLSGQQFSIPTNYHRELVYNLEHCIHHQALIKVALLPLENICVEENFGVAPSTLEYRKQCAP
ncbi:DinB family protein [Flavobacterium sp. CYK-4]|uniref:DinB family protein n=1 Tax=Flavobacterium lotistagni TaxID=2709660 RepID=UPI0014091EC7|nr:DinB family protein [Flavobacterium lotistagni]NHM08173.1 DinB family protein [Flavobacterium lotistagni]